MSDCVTFAEFNANMERTRRVRFPYFVSSVCTRATYTVTYSSLIVSVFKRAPVLALRNLLNVEGSDIHALGCLFSDVVTCIHVATLLFLFTRNPLTVDGIYARGGVLYIYVFLVGAA